MGSAAALGVEALGLEGVCVLQRVYKLAGIVERDDIHVIDRPRAIGIVWAADADSIAEAVLAMPEDAGFVLRRDACAELGIERRDGRVGLSHSKTTKRRLATAQLKTSPSICSILKLPFLPSGP